MPLSVMRSVKSELLTQRKGQAACWVYIYWECFWCLRFFPLVPLLLFGTRSFWNFMTLSFFWDKTVKMPRSATATQRLTAHSSWRTTWITHAKSTNSGNAKMLMPTFTRGCEVGLFKQWEVCKVKKEITHSQRASEVHTSVKQQKIHNNILKHSMMSLNALIANEKTFTTSSLSTKIKINTSIMKHKGTVNFHSDWSLLRKYHSLHHI